MPRKVSTADKYKNPKDVPISSSYWHFRTNDLSEEQFNKLKNLDCMYIYISEIEKEDEKGEHYHAVIKFYRSYNKITARNLIIFNKDLKIEGIKEAHYLQPKYKYSTEQQFKDYVLKKGIRFTNQEDLEQEAVSEIQIEQQQYEDEQQPESEPKISKAELNKLRFQKAREADLNWFTENDFNFMLSTQFARLQVLAQEDCKDTLSELDNYWIYGPSGTNKSSVIHYLYPERYCKIISNSKWDSYSNHNPGHKVVHIDELDDFTDIQEGLEGLAGLKRIADRYPVAVRSNYSNRTLYIRPNMIIITANFSPAQLLSGADQYGRVRRGIEIQKAAIHRKFKVMHISQFLIMKQLKWNNETKTFDKYDYGTETYIVDTPDRSVLDDLEF